MRIVCLSDTHGYHRDVDVPAGDVVLVAGDLTRRGRLEEIRAFDAWLGELPHGEKVVIAGNHDFGFERDPTARDLLTNARYLQDEGLELEGFALWGSPWQPWFYDWAFNLPRGEELRRVWQRIPEETDILMTHGPPAGVLDRCADGRRVGCEDLREAVERVQPLLHVFGHIHEAYGFEEHGDTLFVNASNCNREYRPTQPAIVVELVAGQPARIVS